MASYLVLRYFSPGTFSLRADNYGSCGGGSPLRALDMHERMRRLRVLPVGALSHLPAPEPHEVLIARIDSRALYMKTWSARMGVTGRTLSFPAAIDKLHYIDVRGLLSDPDGFEL